jgi:hypothetical protein
MVKSSGRTVYLFAVGMRDGSTEATFTFSGMNRVGPVEVLGENRTLTATNGLFNDHFNPWAVHLYKLPAPEKSASAPDL